MKEALLIAVGFFIAYMIIKKKGCAGDCELEKKRIRENLKQWLESDYAEGLGINAEKVYKQIYG